MHEPLDVVKLTPLMECTRGRVAMMVGFIDGSRGGSAPRGALPPL